MLKIKISQQIILTKLKLCEKHLVRCNRFTVEMAEVRVDDMLLFLCEHCVSRES